MFGFKRHEVMGLDIGSSAVKAVQLRRSQHGWTVVAAAIAEISDERATDDPGHKEAGDVRAINRCLRLAGMRTRLAVCGVGGPEVVVRNFGFSAVPADETEKAVLLEAKQVCPFNTDEIAVDYCLLDNSYGGAETTGYLVVATENLVKGKARLAKRAGLDCTLMDIDGLALLNCFKEVEQPSEKQETAILSVGSKHTTLAIEGKNGCPFIRDLSYAGDSIIEDVADRNNLETEEVSRILSAKAREIDPDIRKSFEKACHRLVIDINKTFRYYAAVDRSSDIQKILVCGGFALFAGLAEFLDKQLPMKVGLWNPFDKMRCHAEHNHHGVLLRNILQKHGPAMAIGAGLAMRNV
ncbi:MAG: type IV pilus assembly protein PilM [Planctomycetota bacterium]|jgi:type IV pilus assembly protein PilM